MIFLKFIKVLFFVILLCLAVIGAATLEFLFTATEYDEDDLDNKESK